MESRNELEGQTVSVQVDGGRTRTRSELKSISPLENCGKTQSEIDGSPGQGCSKKTLRRGTFTATYREPKVFKIYVYDHEGRKNEAFSELIDGSFGDADYLERLIAMQMPRLGVSKAKSITFNSDGATWIWDRIDSILARAKVPASVLRFKVLDVYHAAENLQKGIKSLGDQTGDVLTFPSLRTKLRDGLWNEVANALEAKLELSSNDSGLDRGEVLCVIRDIRQHGEAEPLDYPKYSLMGLPLGIGSIESSIRRVINLRMKSNGTFWRVPKAERILVLRASLLRSRWDEDRERVKRGMQKSRKQAMPPIRESNLSTTDARQSPMETQ